MKLADFLKERNITQVQLGEMIGKDQSTVHRYMTGALIPPLETVAKIDDISGGAVSFRDFVPPSEPEAAA